MRAAGAVAFAVLLTATFAYAQDFEPDVTPPGADNAPAESPFEVVPPPPPDDALMTGEELRAAFEDRSYEGCYPDGSPWAERTGADGALFDLLRSGSPRVGVWWVQQNQICYFYDASGVTACWNAARQDGEFYFFFPGTGVVGGTTDCGEPIA